MFDILDTVNKWLSEGQAVALATVVETWGSSPRQAGAKMAVTADTAMIGSVSGGCVETAVVEEAVDSLGNGRPRLLHYGVGDETAWSVGLACGGKMSVFVEPLDKAWWQAISDRIKDNHAMATVSVIDGPAAGQKLLYDMEGGIAYASKQLPADVAGSLVQAARAAIEQKRPSRSRLADFDVMLDVHRPDPWLYIIGGAHVAMALASFGRQVGFRVAIIDPRQVFATDERFPGIEKVFHSYPDKALLQLGLNSETYVAVLTHDPKIDDPALRVALPSKAPYVGVLSSKRSHEQRIERLKAAGVDPALLARIHTPIGLEIGARTPEEIALCIMAEIVAVRNGARA
jgi:xanthine dehydrogenase accessory factor